MPEDSLSIFASVFSARVNFKRRALFRELWMQSHDDIKDKSLLRFKLCKPDKAVAEEDINTGLALMEENRSFGDLDQLDCVEGRERGKMALKGALALENYRKNPVYSKHSLFMHVE